MSSSCSTPSVPAASPFFVSILLVGATARKADDEEEVTAALEDVVAAVVIVAGDESGDAGSCVVRGEALEEEQLGDKDDGRTCCSCSVEVIGGVRVRLDEAEAAESSVVVVIAIVLNLLSY